MAEEGAPAFSMVVADHQTLGRGRHGRTWIAPAGHALTMSVVLRPRVEAARLGRVGMAVGLAAIEALDALGGSPRGAANGPSSEPLGVARFALKWPNDLVAVPGQAKLGGVLLESWRSAETAGAQRPDWIDAARSLVVLAGIGINISTPLPELPHGATSLAEQGAAAADRTALAADIVRRLRARIALLEAGGDLVADWRARMATVGELVVVWAADGVTERARGRAVDVGPDGGLVLELADGTREVVHAGDVTLAGGG